MLEFLIENYKLFVIVGSCLLDLILFVICCCLKKKKSISIDEQILGLMPIAIKAAEDLYGSGNGEKKKQYVMDFVSKQFKKWTGYELKPGCLEYGYFVAFMENILATPTKKGEKDENKK